MHISALHVYPVKSLRGCSVPVADVERQGLRHDRRWMLVDEDGVTLTARTLPAMLSVTASAEADGSVVLTAAGHPPLHVDVPHDGRAVPVTLSRVGSATEAGADAAGWLSEVLGRAVRLVWLDDPHRRTVSPQHGGHVGDVLNLSDTGPLLLTSTASLERLDRWIADTYAARYAECGALAGSRPTPLAMERFRPNVVVDGVAEPFAEDGWDSLEVGAEEGQEPGPVRWRTSELADRCVVTTLDPGTLVRGQEPLRTLARHRRWDGHVWFGTRLVPTTTGQVRVGDVVRATGRPGRGPLPQGPSSGQPVPARPAR